MTDAAPAPLVIETAEYAPFGEARVVVEVAGRWLEEPPVPSGESALLIVDAGGLVHRFPEISAGFDQPQADDAYLASFVVPTQFRGRIESSTALRAGGVTVTVPGAVLTGGADAAAPDPDPDPVVAALRQELSERIAEQTRLRRETGQLRAQLEARASGAERLEHAQAELRDAVAELTARLEADEGHRVALESSNAALEAANASLSAELASLREALERAQAEVTRIAAERDAVAAERDAVAAELSDRYAELAVTRVSHETALGEVTELRRELERGGAELGDVQEQPATSELEEAESLLAETRALTARLLARGGESHAGD